MAVSTAYEYRDRNDLGASGFVVYHFHAVIGKLFYPTMDRSEFDKLYFTRLEAECGKPEELSRRGERNRAAWRLLLAHLREYPGRFAVNYGKGFAKAVFVPSSEGAVSRILYDLDLEAWYEPVARPILFVLWLPVWILALLPPVRQSRSEVAFYCLVMLVTLYVLGLSSFAPGGGDRMRFPVFPFWLILAAASAHRLSLRFQRRNRQRQEKGSLTAD